MVFKISCLYLLLKNFLLICIKPFIGKEGETSIFVSVEKQEEKLPLPRVSENPTHVGAKKKLTKKKKDFSSSEVWGVFAHKEKRMDKKMHVVTKKMKVAEKDIAKGKPSKAKEVLKKAEKRNERLVKEDKMVRDPLIKKCKKEMKSSKR